MSETVTYTAPCPRCGRDCVWRARQASPMGSQPFALEPECRCAVEAYRKGEAWHLTT